MKNYPSIFLDMAAGHSGPDGVKNCPCRAKTKDDTMNGSALPHETQDLLRQKSMLWNVCQNGNIRRQDKKLLQKLGFREQNHMVFFKQN